MAKAVFKSRFAGLELTFKREQKQVVGNEIIKVADRRTINFVNGIYTTEDPDEIAFLRNGKWGVDVIELPSVQEKSNDQTPAKTGAKPPKKPKGTQPPISDPTSDNEKAEGEQGEDDEPQSGQE